jgi:hypothetical protein
MEHIKVLGIVGTMLVIYIGEHLLLSEAYLSEGEKDYLMDCGNVKEFSSYEDICKEHDINTIWIP